MSGDSCALEGAGRGRCPSGVPEASAALIPAVRTGFANAVTAAAALSRGVTAISTKKPPSRLGM